MIILVDDDDEKLYCYCSIFLLKYYSNMHRYIHTSILSILPFSEKKMNGKVKLLAELSTSKADLDFFYPIQCCGGGIYIPLCIFSYFNIVYYLPSQYFSTLSLYCY